MPPGEREQSREAATPSSGRSGGPGGSSIDDLGEGPRPQYQADLNSNPYSAVYRLCVVAKSFRLWESLGSHPPWLAVMVKRASPTVRAPWSLVEHLWFCGA